MVDTFRSEIAEVRDPMKETDVRLSAHPSPEYHVLEPFTAFSERTLFLFSAKAACEESLLSHDLFLKVGLDLRAISRSALDLADQKMCVFKMGGADRFDIPYIGRTFWLKNTRSCWKYLGGRIAGSSFRIAKSKSNRDHNQRKISLTWSLHF